MSIFLCILVVKCRHRPENNSFSGLDLNNRGDYHKFTDARYSEPVV